MNIDSLLRERQDPATIAVGAWILSLQTAHLESGALAFSLESQWPAPKATEGRKGGKLTYFNHTTCWYHLDA